MTEASRYKGWLMAIGLVPMLMQGVAAAEVEKADEGFVTELIGAVVGGQPSLDVRLRWENAKIDGSKTSNALTVRTRLGYSTRPLYGVSGLLEFVNVASPKPGWYFDGVDMGGADKSIVADPELTEANRFWLMLDRKDWGGSSIKAGRQRIKLDDDRWIGNVGWRQNEQTYDAVRVQSHLAQEALLVQYIFAWETNRIFGDKGPANRRDFGMKSHWVNISYDAGDYLQATGFVYLIDANDPFARNSTNTFGLRAVGRGSLTDSLESSYELSWAYQMDAGDNPVDYDAFYYHLAAGLELANVGFVRFGYEVLGSDNGKAQVVTPLSTAHKFNGFADAFLTNGGPRGLRDVYIVLAPEIPLDGVGLRFIVHQFYSDQGGDDLGYEVDAVSTYRYNRYLSFLYKLAYYDEGGSGSPESRMRHVLETTIRF